MVKLDRSVVERLYRRGDIAGELVDGILQLSRASVAAYLWSRPRCAVDGCNTRVVGSPSPDCQAHRREPVNCTCDWCGEAFQRRRWELRGPIPPRFCSHSHRAMWLNHGEGSEERRAARLRGVQHRRESILAEAAEKQLMTLDEVVAALPGEVRRTRSVVAEHTRNGDLVPARDVARNLGGLLFSRAALDAYITWLERHPDGRSRRFNITGPEARPFRAVWYRARYKSEREFGRLASVIAAADDGRRVGRPALPVEKQDQIRGLRSAGLSVRAIARIAAVGRGQVERLVAQDKVSRNPPTRA
jgi:hypothetical protein